VPVGKRGAQQTLGGGEAVHTRHSHIHEHDVGPLRADHLYRAVPVGGLADHDEVRLGGQERDQARPDDWLIVDDHHSDGHVTTVPS
jgi:hypothetical protein